MTAPFHGTNIISELFVAAIVVIGLVRNEENLPNSGRKLERRCFGTN
jgi:hypothetical protein